jgi:hypothetical protein
MKRHDETSFLRWAADRGIALDPRYPESFVLQFVHGAGDARFWSVPSRPERRPYFLGSMLELMGNWKSCCVWRHLGGWPREVDPLRINDVVEHQILTGLALPMGTADVIEFAAAESAALITLLFSTTVFGWSVGQDVYVVPDHGRCLLQTDHHEVVHVDVRDSTDLASWVSEMEKRGFALPEDVPDPSFKRPVWLPEA